MPLIFGLRINIKEQKPGAEFFLFRKLVKAELPEQFWYLFFYTTSSNSVTFQNRNEVKSSRFNVLCTRKTFICKKNTYIPNLDTESNINYVIFYNIRTLFLLCSHILTRRHRLRKKI